MIVKLPTALKFICFHTGLGNYMLSTQHKAAAQAVDEVFLIKCYPPEEVVDRIRERLERNESMSNDSGEPFAEVHVIVISSIHTLHVLIIGCDFHKNNCQHRRPRKCLHDCVTKKPRPRLHYCYVYTYNKLQYI